jgi:sugar phosphate isomerase/epimerase
MIFVSTSSLNNHSDAVETVKRLADEGIKNIELGADHSYPANVKKIIDMKKEFGLNYTAHVFFPPAKEKLMLNLGSGHKDVLRKSINAAKDAIEFCNKAEAKVYSLHSGTVNEIDRYGNPLSKPIPKQGCIDIMKSSMTELSDYAKRYDIKLALENHTAMPGIELFTRPAEIAQLIKELKLKNTGLLVDVGHLNVTSKRFGFDKNKEIEEVSDMIIEFHISENNGENDEHNPLTSQKMIEFLPKELLKEKIATVEMFNKDMEGVKRSIEIIEKFIGHSA